MMFIVRSCIVSRRFFWRPEFRIRSSVNSKSSQIVARDMVKEKISIAARIGLVLILSVLFRTYTTDSPTRPSAIEAVKVIRMFHQRWS